MNRFWEAIETAITCYPPQKRRRLAIKILFWSVVLMVVNVVLYLVGIVDQASLILVTLILSWLAVTATCVDWILTADVRVEEERD